MAVFDMGWGVRPLIVAVADRALGGARSATATGTWINAIETD